MKRYIKASEERYPGWCEKVRRAVDASGLSDRIQKYEEDNDAEYPCVYVTLKSPYVCKYYNRVGCFINEIILAPNQADYISPGQPELLFTVSNNLSDNAATARLIKLNDKISEMTQRKQQQ